MSSSLPLIRLENICRSFDEGAVVALDHISLAIYPGDCTAILGKSGSGKSTLINILCGCDCPTAGTIYWLEKPVRDHYMWRRLRADRIGIVFQEFHLLPALTALENVEMALMAQGVAPMAREQRAAELLARMGLTDRMKQRPAALSGGERQRVAIARSLANNPAVLLADEPTGSLDSASAASIMNLLLEIQETQGTALVLVTHDEGWAARCRRRIIIKDGRVVDAMRELETPHREPRANGAEQER